MQPKANSCSSIISLRKPGGAGDEVKPTQRFPEYRFSPLKSLLATACDSGKGVCVQPSKAFFKKKYFKAIMEMGLSVHLLKGRRDG